MSSNLFSVGAPPAARPGVIGNHCCCIERRASHRLSSTAFDINNPAQSAKLLSPEILPSKVPTVSAQSERSRTIDQPPIGILLCTQKNHDMVQFALADMNNSLFVSRYQLQLPQQGEMEEFLRKAMAELGVEVGRVGV